MQRAYVSPTQTRRLAVCLLLSVTLHAAVLFGIRAQKPSKVPPRQQLTVYFSPPSSESAIPQRKTRAEKRYKSALLTAPRAEAPITVRSDMTTPTPEDVFTTQRILESAKTVAREEARKIEAQGEAKRNTPAGLLSRYLRQPHKEIRLANGMLKIVTDAGAVCFQPVPYFAHDTPGLFGLPTTCP